MIGFQKKYADKGFTLLGVAMDEEGKSVVEPYVQKTQFDVDGHPTTMNYPIVLGNDDLADKFGGLLGLPTTFVITREGKVAKRYIGLAHRKRSREINQSLLTAAKPGGLFFSSAQNASSSASTPAFLAPVANCGNLPIAMMNEQEFTKICDATFEALRNRLLVLGDAKISK